MADLIISIIITIMLRSFMEAIIIVTRQPMQAALEATRPLLAA
jgi:hypothetical protein